jgi:hypothetical protein
MWNNIKTLLKTTFGYNSAAETPVTTPEPTAAPVEKKPVKQKKAKTTTTSKAVEKKDVGSKSVIKRLKK